MRLLSLHLEQFRSYDRQRISFAKEGGHLLLGPNGAGKTNVLEAVSVLSLTRSFLGAEEADLIGWGTELYSRQGEIRTDAGEDRTVEVVSQMTPRKQKACFVSDVRVPVGDFVGTLPSVQFLPHDLDLFRGSPAARRTLLDQLLSQVSPGHLRALSVYQRTLKQRNALLRRLGQGIGSPDDLTVWDDHLAREGASITLRRLELLETLQCGLCDELRSLGEEWDDARLVYERHGEGRDFEHIQGELRAELLRVRDRDILLQSTTTGPHRHDWRLEAGGRPIAVFASRGQQRAALLALLFLQVSYLELQRGEKPIVLLDDVFSELDDAHQSALLAALADTQVLLSSTHLPPRAEDLNVWTVGEGAVLEQEV